MKRFKNEFIYYAFCGFLGVVIATIVWTFMRFMNVSIKFIWEIQAEAFSFKFYPLVVCTIGGVLIGIYQKITHVVPDELHTIIRIVQKDKFYPYNKVILLIFSALLPLIFGGSIGPEAGMTGIIVMLCYWAGERMKLTQLQINDMAEMGLSTALGNIFFAPLFGLVAPYETEDSEINPDVVKKKGSTIIAVVCSFGTFKLLGTLFGGGTGFPRISGFDITAKERFFAIVLMAIGIASGLLFEIFEEAAKKIFENIRGKGLIILSTVSSGVILGLVGTFLPLTMFSGEESIEIIYKGYISYSPWILILTGLLKLLITNICIHSGWKGGHFFPVIFCGVSIGFGVGMLCGMDPGFCAAVLTSTLLGTTMKKPLAVTVLLMLCFDVRIIPWILIASFIGSKVNLKKKFL